MTETAKTSREPAPRPSKKRTRLVEAARALLHQQGVERTTLADVAQASGVPLGNVYYYFRTKNELVAAVIEAHAEELEQLLTSLDELPDALDRLKALIGSLEAQSEVVAESGCPIGSLCTELDKRDDGLDLVAKQLLGRMLGWVENQFRLAGRADGRELAVAFVAAYQGVAVLTNTLREPALLRGESARIRRWLEELR